jgi:polyisoprenoid-binding protein YceI
MFKAPLLLPALLATAFTVQAAPAAITADMGFIRFVSKQLNVPVEGRFRKFAGHVEFDPVRPEGGTARFEVELGSIDMGSPESESEVKKKEWFNAGMFPRATFTSEGVKALGGGRFEARGKLTIKGATQPVSAQFTSADAAGTRTLDGSFIMKRLAFNIGEGEWKATDTVADDVQVKFRFTYQPK